MSAKGPDLKRYMEKKLLIRLVGKRKVTGYLRGYDQFMNLVVEDCVEVTLLVQVLRGHALSRGAPPTYDRRDVFGAHLGDCRRTAQ